MSTTMPTITSHAKSWNSSSTSWSQVVDLVKNAKPSRMFEDKTFIGIVKSPIIANIRHVPILFRIQSLSGIPPLKVTTVDKVTVAFLTECGDAVERMDLDAYKAQPIRAGRYWDVSHLMIRESLESTDDLVNDTVNDILSVSRDELGATWDDDEIRSMLLRLI